MNKLFREATSLTTNRGKFCKRAFPFYIFKGASVPFFAFFFDDLNVSQIYESEMNSKMGYWGESLFKNVTGVPFRECYMNPI